MSQPSTPPLDLSTLTPDDHLASLREMVRSFEASAKWLNNLGPTMLGNHKARRAAAIRWILEETAHGVDVKDLAV